MARNTIYLWDNDGIGYEGKHPGYLGFKFLKTPEGLGLASFHPDVYTNSLPNVPKNTTLMWKWLSGGIDSTNLLLTVLGDNIVNFGTGPFSLAAGETKEISLAIFVSHNFQDLVNDAINIYYESNWPNVSSVMGEEGGDSNYKINLTSTNFGVINGNFPINLQYAGNDPNAKMFLECSSDGGINWEPIAGNIPVGSQYIWNTTNFKDGVNYLLRVIAYNDSLNNEYYYDVSDTLFTINNPANAQPELKLVGEYKDTTFTQPNIPISWMAQDADNSTLNIKAEYSLDKNGPFTTIFDDDYSTGSHTYIWNVKDLPNSTKYYLKLTASDGSDDSSLTTGTFSINYAINSYIIQNFVHLSGIATPDIYLQVADTSQITNDTYEITFDTSGGQKEMSIKDIVKNTFLISNYPLIDSTSTPTFDGIKLTLIDKATGINYDRSTFNRSELNSYVQIVYPPIVGNPKVKDTEDWIIAFNNLDTSSTGNYLNPGDTVLNQYGNLVVCPFKVINTDAKQKAVYRIYETAISARNNGKWDFDEPIILQPQSATGATTSYQVNFDFSSGNLPQQGDTLKIITDKTITPNDVFRFAVDSADVITGIKSKNIISSYKLYQNYPNPFNPNTTISYETAEVGFVTLKVYDILGREVRTIVNKYETPGKYTVNFNAANLASGVYLYTLKIFDEKSGKDYFISTKKLILLK